MSSAKCRHSMAVCDSRSTRPLDVACISGAYTRGHSRVPAADEGPNNMSHSRLGFNRSPGCMTRPCCTPWARLGGTGFGQAAQNRLKLYSDASTARTVYAALWLKLVVGRISLPFISHQGICSCPPSNPKSAGGFTPLMGSEGPFQPTLLIQLSRSGSPGSLSQSVDSPELLVPHSIARAD